jgi:hypothetical protein
VLTHSLKNLCDRFVAWISVLALASWAAAGDVGYKSCNCHPNCAALRSESHGYFRTRWRAWTQPEVPWLATLPLPTYDPGRVGKAPATNLPEPTPAEKPSQPQPPTATRPQAKPPAPLPQPQPPAKPKKTS